MKRIGHAAVMQAHGDVAGGARAGRHDSARPCDEAGTPVMHGTRTALQLQCSNDKHSVIRVGGLAQLDRG